MVKRPANRLFKRVRNTEKLMDLRASVLQTAQMLNDPKVIRSYQQTRIYIGRTRKACEMAAKELKNLPTADYDGDEKDE